MPALKQLLLVAILFASLQLSAQVSESWYVAAKNGLSLREKPGASAPLVENIPYGSKIAVLEVSEEWVEVKSEGMTGAWRKVKYNNKTGYVVNTYLFPVPPPKSTVKDLAGYLAQLSPPFGSKLIVKSGTMQNIEDIGWELHKQLYKNGGEWHKFLGYEYGSDTYFLPGFTMEQAFLLVRLLPEFREVFGEKEEYPTADKTWKKGDREYRVRVDKETFEGGFSWINRITVEFEDGAIYNFEMFTIDNQIVISFGSGV